MVMWASIPAHGSDPVGLYNSGLARSSEVDGCRDLMHCMFFLHARNSVVYRLICLACRNEERAAEFDPGGTIGHLDRPC